MRAVILNIVSDEELTISIITGSVIALFSIGGVLFNIYAFVKPAQQRNKMARVVLILIFLVIFFFAYKDTTKNILFYKHSTQIEGKVVGFCKTPRNEDGVLFEYTINNKTYTNCNPYFPFPKDSIKINRYYRIRVNTLQPEDGRILLNK